MCPRRLPRLCDPHHGRSHACERWSPSLASCGVDHQISAELLQLGGLRIVARSGEYTCTGMLRYLQGEEGNSARALDDNRMTGLNAAVKNQRIPRRNAGIGTRAAASEKVNDSGIGTSACSGSTT